MPFEPVFPVANNHTGLFCIVLFSLNNNIKFSQSESVKILYISNINLK